MTHSHSHGHGDVGSWQAWRRDPLLSAVLGVVAAMGVLTLIGVVMLWPDGSGRQEVQDTATEIGFVSELYEATVVEVVDAPCSFATSDDSSACRTLSFELDAGPDRGEIVTLPEFSLEFEQTIPQGGVGAAVILGYEPQTETYSYNDRDRRSPMLWLAALFAVVVVALGRVRGVLALAAMALTVVVLVGFVAPSVLDGNDPLLVAVVGAAVIAFVSLYLTHGFSPTTTVALASTLFALLLTLTLSWVFFELSAFTGLATEESSLLPLLSSNIDLASLLLGGAVLGALGALDDVTVTQVATVAELRAQRPDLTLRQLFAAGVRVGREHIASTVNTLLLAYVGASIPLLLLFAASDQSLGLVANSEVVATEIVRTMCGSIGLVAAVPIATGLTALVVEQSAVSHDSPRPVAVPRERAQPESARPEPRRTQWDDFAPDGDFWGDEQR